MSHYPAVKMKGQFLYSRLAEDYGLNGNQTSGNHKSNCNHNTSSPVYDLQQKVNLLLVLGYSFVTILHGRNPLKNPKLLMGSKHEPVNNIKPIN